MDTPLIEPAPAGLASAKVLGTATVYNVDREGQGTAKINEMPNGTHVIRRRRRAGCPLTGGDIPGQLTAAARRKGWMPMDDVLRIAHRIDTQSTRVHPASRPS